MSWKPIVVGVDGSPESVGAAVAGAMIAERAGAQCHLVCAVPDYERQLLGQGMVIDTGALTRDIISGVRGTVRSSLRGQVPTAMVEALDIQVGSASLVLGEAARRAGAGLIIVGARQHRGLDRLRGRLIRRLLHSCDVPLLVADRGASGVQRILAALDLSWASAATWEEAQRWGRLFGAPVRAMHVVEPAPALPFGTAKVRSEFAAEYYRANLRLRESGPWSTIGDNDAEKVLRDGEPVPAIVAEVAQWHADLLIVGSHGKGWIDRHLLGSTTDELLRHPLTLTLVVPAVRPPLVQFPDVESAARKRSGEAVGALS